jgi:hypothetical protein
MDQELLHQSMKNPVNVMELFENKEIVKICAPMVRYSKYPNTPNALAPCLTLVF